MSKALFYGWVFSFLLASAATQGACAQDQGAQAAGAAPPLDASLIIAPGREFSANSYVHRPLAADASIDPQSSAWVAELLKQVKDYYGTIAVGYGDYSPPVYVVGPDQPTVRVLAERRSDPNWRYPPLQAQWQAVPLPENFHPALGTDEEMVVYQPSTARYWEFWQMEKTGRETKDSANRDVDEWRAAWGGEIDDMRTNGGFFKTTTQGAKFGATATGLPYLAGLMTIKEMQRGEIDHPLHFAIPKIRAKVWSFPAQRTDGVVDDANAIPAGVVFRFPQDLNFDAMPMHPFARMVAKAIQKHGMILRDTAGAVVLYAENPANRYTIDPYTGIGGILDCPQGKSSQVCWADSGNRLKGIPWEKLVALKAQFSSR